MTYVAHLEGGGQRGERRHPHGFEVGGRVDATDVLDACDIGGRADGDLPRLGERCQDEDQDREQE